MGSNAYRTSHNPPTPELLDACDRLGMLVLDETRMMDATDEGLSQLERLVRRDRNHPSVFCWSIGNEEPEQGTERGARVAATMKRKVRELDPTRLVTEAMNNAWGRGLSAVVDVQGFNYRGGAAAADFGKALDDYHRQHPTQPTMGTEVASTVSTRGIYANDETRGYVSSYDRNFPPWASTAEEWWSHLQRAALGRGRLRLDRLRLPRRADAVRLAVHQLALRHPRHLRLPQGPLLLLPGLVERRSRCSTSSRTGTGPGKEGQDIEVWCFTNLDRVELFVNGTSAGAQDVKQDSHVAWKVPYAPGAIEARGTTGRAARSSDTARDDGRAGADRPRAGPTDDRSPTARTSRSSSRRSSTRKAGSCRRPTTRWRSPLRVRAASSASATAIRAATSPIARRSAAPSTDSAWRSSRARRAPASFASRPARPAWRRRSRS